MDELARDLQSLNRHQEAEPLLREALEIRMRTLGPAHHDTVVPLFNLADALRAQGKKQEAERFLRQNIEIRKRVLGPEHPDTLYAINRPAFTLTEEKRFDEAEALHQQLYEIRSRAPGPHHPDTLYSIYSLGSLEAVRGNRSSALGYLREAVDRGYANPWMLEADTDLVSLHGEPEFKAILAKAHENEKAAAKK